MELVKFGGVDTQSSPINEPVTRWLRCNNWVPKAAGNLELRWGYDTLSATSTTAAIHSLIPQELWDGSNQLLVGQSTSLSVYDFTSNTLSAVTGETVTSSAQWGSYDSDNRTYLGNGTDQLVYSGSAKATIPNGIRAPNASDFINFTISQGTRELSSTEASTITLTQGSSGSFSATATGYLFYVVLFDTTYNDAGPATINVSSGRINVTGSSKKITVGNMLTPSSATWVKLIARTGDGDNIAYFCTNTSTSISATSLSGIILTCTATSHGLSTGDVVIQNFVSTMDDPKPYSAWDGVFVVTVLNANQYTVTLQDDFTGQVVTTGTVKRIVKAANATSSIDVTDTARDNSFVVNASRGIAATSVGGSQPGYQFYGSFMFVNDANEITGHSTAKYGNHVGNRFPIGARYAPTVRANVRLNNVPTSLDDSRWRLLIGRTGDGGAVPYAMADNDSVWAVSPQTANAFILPHANIDGNSELPTRNGVIPAECTMFARVGDRIYAADPNSPTIRRSASEADANTGIFVGDPAQSWSPDDIETHPRAKRTTGIHEVDSELFVGTKRDCAILSDLQGLLSWRGPWKVGNAGPRSMVITPYGFFWVTGEKQLATFVNGIPQIVSSEYEVGLLSGIGNTYLGSTTLSYYKSAQKLKDEIRIECRDSSGNPFTVIHDFKLIDAQSPAAQGYGSTFTGELATAFTVAQASATNDELMNFAGGANGYLYQLYTGANDVGNEYTADAIGLMNLGVDRPTVPCIDWHGDSAVQVSVGISLGSTTDTNSKLRFEATRQSAVAGAANDFLYRSELVRPQPFSHMFVRFQLTSHSADGDLTLNDPPHCPLESYGRIWDVIPSIGDQRGR